MRERERWQEISETDYNMSENLLRIKSYLKGIRREKIPGVTKECKSA